MVNRRAISPRARLSRSVLRRAVESLESRTLFAAAPAAAAAAVGHGPSQDPSEILVHFKQDVPPGLAGRDILANTDLGDSIGADHRLHEVKLGNGVGVEAALAAYKKNPLVDYAEPNWIYTTQATSNDPYYTNGSLWGMYGDTTTPANAYGSQAGAAWTGGATGSQNVFVGIIDEGIQYTHPDLAANAWNNPYDTAGDGIDNDGNGYVDDVHGWDFDGNNNSVYDGTQDDHGTHVTGTIAAKGGNGAGVAGVDWDVTYISGKFLGANGGTTANAIKAVDYFTDLKTRHGMNIVALNNSWGGGGFSQGLLDAITRAAKANILFVAAAGNGGSDQVGDNNDSVASYPSNYNTTAGAGYDSVVAVAAIDSQGRLGSFSNYGATTVDLAAPGVSILSTVPDGTYGGMSGTSMATPHVTGAAALYASTHPGATALQIKNALLDAARATPTASLAGKTVTGGRLDVLKMMTQPPAAPTALTAAVDPGTPTSQINLTWTDNASDETGFIIERAVSPTTPDATTTWTQLTTTTANVTAYSDAGLVDGTRYWYRVRATGGGGTSSPSNVAGATTSAVTGSSPAAASGLTATALSASAISLKWSDNSGNETGFRVERAPAGSTSWTAVMTTGANVVSYSDTGLAAGTAYSYRVIAFNGSGDSTPTPVVTAATLGTGNGLTGKYYDYNTRDTSTAPSAGLAFGNLKMTRVDPAVNFNWGSGSPAKGISNDTYAVRWTGQVQPTMTDVYTFTAYADDGVRLWVDGKLVIDAWRVNWGDLAGTTATPLQAGQKYNVQLDYFENTQSALVRLDWQTQSGSLARQTVPTSQLYSTVPVNTPIYSAASTAAPVFATSVAAGTSPAQYDTTDIFSSSPIDVLDVGDASVL